MGANSVEELSRRILADLVRSSLAGALAGGAGLESGKLRRPRSIALSDEDLFTRLRSIRGCIVTKELASLMRWHSETIYRLIKTEGLPVHRTGKRLKFYPPEVASWLAKRSGRRA
jgi:excisionase family DNA binding protein